MMIYMWLNRNIYLYKIKELQSIFLKLILLAIVKKATNKET